MNKQTFSAAPLLALLLFGLSGCTSVPHVDRAVTVVAGEYDVVIDRDYLENPEELRYAINSFVKDQGQTSYDVEKYGPNDFHIYAPGTQKVEDLPEVKHFHGGRTTGAILGGLGGVGGLVLLLFEALGL